MIVRSSHVLPNVIIEASSESDVLKAENALSKIGSRPNGKGILNQVYNNARNGKTLKISVVSGRPNSTYPTLTLSQIVKHKASPDEKNIENIIIASSLAQKRGKGRKGEGTSSIIEWNPNLSVDVDIDGIPFRGFDKNAAFLSLTHELIHGYRILKGTFLGNDRNERNNPDSLFMREEDRAVGVNKSKSNNLSENGVRKEHGYPLRSQYLAGR